jgi:SNF family Na+-dependent transporter
MFVLDLPAGGWVLLAFLLAFTLATIAIYVEEVSYIMKTFKIPKRKKTTIWILAFFPVNLPCHCREQVLAETDCGFYQFFYRKTSALLNGCTTRWEISWTECRSPE